MAKIIDGGWLKPKGNDEDVTIGTATSEIDKAIAQNELEKRLKESQKDSD